jgi:uncharacterized protein YdhG (YjbR/CyaY superfamily)
MTMATTKTTKTGASRNEGGKFTSEEKAAMRERAKEAKAAAAGADLEKDQLDKIAEMTGNDRDIAERIAGFIKAEVPALAARTWYGMPAWAKDGKVICFFQPAMKFKVRYATFGFQPASKFKARYPTFAFTDEAKIDEGSLWPVAWGLQSMTDADLDQLGALIKRAVS